MNSWNGRAGLLDVGITCGDFRTACGSVRLDPFHADVAHQR